MRTYKTKNALGLAVILFVSFLITVYLLVSRRDNIMISRIKSSHGLKQSELIHHYSRYLTENIDVGTDKKIVLDILGPPLNSQDDPIWLYPRAENKEKIDPGFYCIIIDGKVVIPISKVVAVDFEQSYRNAEYLNKTNYNKLIATVNKYVYKK